MHWVGETELHIYRLRISLHAAAESVLREIHYQVALIILVRRGKHQQHMHINKQLTKLTN